MAQKGFTLIEILIVIFVMVILATSALMSFSQSAKTFDYFSQLKSLVMQVREVKSFAGSNKEFECDVEGVLADSFAVRVEEDGFEVLEGGCVRETVDLSETNYRIEAVDALGDLDFPVDLSYERGTGVFRAFENGVLVTKVNNAYVSLRFYDEVAGVERFVVIFQVSGLPEVFENLNNL